MGYRNYLYKIKKQDVNKIRNLTLQELKEKYGKPEEDYYVSFNDLVPNAKCIFEFGKLYWDDTIIRINSTGEKLFVDEEVQEKFSDYGPHLVGKEALKISIEIYTNKVKDMYKNLKEEINTAKTIEERLEIYKLHFQDYMYWWEQDMVIDLEKENICQSWLYEHLIFELVHLYKTINFTR